MPDWTKSMQQTYEFSRVDPYTWDEIEDMDFIKSAGIVYDSSDETLGHASIVTSKEFEECYVRIHLITIQNGMKDRIPLGTFLCQTPGYDYDGKVNDITVDAYTPLIELKEKFPPIGYYVPKNSNVVDAAVKILDDGNIRAPVIEGKNSGKVRYNFVADTDDTWLTFLSDLLSAADLRFGLDEFCQVLFVKNPNILTMKPVWTYNDNNSSILYPDISLERDLYGIPNVVEVVYSDDSKTISASATNSNPDSPISTRSRGRKIVYRESNPESPGPVTKQWLKDYAKQKLKELSTLEYTLTYTHGYCPVKVGDCVQLNYERAGIRNVKALVTRQSIKCEPGCPVEETAVYTMDLWGEDE